MKAGQPTYDFDSSTYVRDITLEQFGPEMVGEYAPSLGRDQLVGGHGISCFYGLFKYGLEFISEENDGCRRTPGVVWGSPSVVFSVRVGQ